MKKLRSKITEFSDIVRSIDNNNETVIKVTVIAKDSDIVSIPVEEKTFREMFTQAIADNCIEETFDIIGMNLLLDDDLFQRYIAFKTVETRNDLESKWIVEAISAELNKAKTQPTNPSEITMTTEQTTQATQTQPKETTMNNEQTTPSKGFDWVSAGKTVGVFVGGAAVGAAGKWAWDHFFG
jgi:hypothetical protein